MPDKMVAEPVRYQGRGGEATLFDVLTDGELLEWFVQRHEEAAFAALVRRHGSMVLSVCRRVLRNSHDAEDAFQATFLVLSEKAHQLSRPELLANWLYGVAYRTALHARHRAARRGEREREAAKMIVPGSEPENDAQELRRVLDEELSRLPEKYRAPLVLCYLEGKTNEEAARLLGWPIGSMSYRLARGRDLLRQRLEGRLAGLSILLPAIFLAEHLQPATVPLFLSRLTAHSAAMVASGKWIVAEVISVSVRELMEATLHSLAASKWKLLLTIALLTASLFCLSAASYASIAHFWGRNSGTAIQYGCGEGPH